MIIDKHFANTETERMVLGAIVMDSKCLFDIGELFTPQIFSDHKHKEIAQVLFEMNNANKPIDSLTLSQALRKSQASIETVMYAGMDLTHGVIFGDNAGAWIQEVVELFVKRKLHEETIRLDHVIQGKIDAFDLIADYEKRIADILPSVIPSKGKTSKQVYDSAIEQMEAMQNRPGGLVGVDTGFAKLNDITAGWKKQELIILAARPGMGKTAMMLKMAIQAAVHRKKSIGVFSLEMSSEMLMNRVLSMESGTHQERILRGQMSKDEFTEIKNLSHIREARIQFDDGNSSLAHIRNKARVWKVKNGVELIFVDYLQLIRNTGSKGNREQQVSEISATLKSIAKELDIPVVALAQLSRDASGSRPQLTHLRESGSIEQDADMVIFIHRPNYYSMATNGVENDVELIVAKHRNGATGLFEINFDPQLTKFYGNESYQSNGIEPSTDF